MLDRRLRETAKRADARQIPSLVYTSFPYVVNVACPHAVEPFGRQPGQAVVPRLRLLDAGVEPVDDRDFPLRDDRHLVD